MTVPAPNLDNSPRLDTLVRDGKLYLSLRDAIDLALENNLDIVIARYNLPIAQADILRTAAGGQDRGVIPALCLERLAVAEPVRATVPEQAGQAQAQVVRARARQDWCRARWAQARWCPGSIRSSLLKRMWTIRSRSCPTFSWKA